LTVLAITSTYFKKPIIESNGPRFKETKIQTNVTDATFHELGHIIYQGRTQNKVINFNNRVRKILKFTNRPDDESHNITIK
jgi:hypothetical protein